MGLDRWDHVFALGFEEHPGQTDDAHSEALSYLTTSPLVREQERRSDLAGQSDGFRFAGTEGLPQLLNQHSVAGLRRIQKACATSAAPGCPAPSSTTSRHTASGTSSSP